jgi:hypothetical protein
MALLQTIAAKKNGNYINFFKYWATPFFNTTILRHTFTLELKSIFYLHK